MLGRRASSLGELAEPPQLHNLGRHFVFFFSQIARRFNIDDKEVKLPCFFGHPEHAGGIM